MMQNGCMWGEWNDGNKHCYEQRNVMKLVIFDIDYILTNETEFLRNHTGNKKIWNKSGKIYRG